MRFISQGMIQDVFLNNNNPPPLADFFLLRGEGGTPITLQKN